MISTKWSNLAHEMYCYDILEYHKSIFHVQYIWCVTLDVMITKEASQVHVNIECLFLYESSFYVLVLILKRVRHFITQDFLGRLAELCAVQCLFKLCFSEKPQAARTNDYSVISNCRIQNSLIEVVWTCLHCTITCTVSVMRTCGRLTASHRDQEISYLDEKCHVHLRNVDSYV